MSKRSNRYLSMFALSSCCAACVQAQTPPAANALTIYSVSRPGAIPPELYRQGGIHGGGQNVPGYAVVRHERDMKLERGRNTVRFSDVAAQIDPTSVAFESLSDPRDTTVVEQNFQFDLVSTAKLLEKYIDRTVTVDQVRGNGVESYTGTLLSTAGGLVLRGADGTVRTLPHNAGVRLPDLPGGLITRPTLVWDIAAGRAGAHKTRVSYQTTGITWWADYNVTYSESPNACRIDLGAWVSILNQSGASYPDAKLKLVAGDVQRATPPIRGRMSADAAMAMRPQEARAPGFEEKSFFEYHLYTLGRATTIPDNSTKQIELFPTARAVPCEKQLVYDGAALDRVHSSSPMTERNFGLQGNRKVDVYLSFRNAQEHNMGMPLPSGRVRVSKIDDADKTLEFIGEDVIDHTPRNEKVLLKLGSAFDVVGERRQVTFSVDTSRKTMTEEIEVRIRNQKKEPVFVTVKENLYRWINGSITQKTHDYRKEDARTVHFPIRVAAGAETTVRYTVHYSW
jgi:hypothetical protein